MTALTISLTESTFGNSFGLPEIMELSVLDASDDVKLSLTLYLRHGAFNLSAVESNAVALLPGCNGIIHLTAAVTNALIKHFTPDHELIDQVFDCEETGGVRKLPLEF